jgi:hypothetical protein
MAKGYDIAEDTTRFLARARSAGVDFVGRYYGGHPSKDLTLIEAQAISRAGLKIVTVWEASGDKIANFMTGQGASDAYHALDLAIACGQPRGSAIYFAVDCDPTAVQIAGNVMPYFAAIAGCFAAAGSPYKIGVYGSGDVCTFLATHGLAEYAWLGGAMGWRGSRSFKAAGQWHMCQGLPSDPYGFHVQVDPDESRTDDYGAWSLPAAGAANPHPVAAHNDADGEAEALNQTEAQRLANR